MSVEVRVRISLKLLGCFHLYTPLILQHLEAKFVGCWASTTHRTQAISTTHPTNLFCGETNQRILRSELYLHKQNSSEFIGMYIRNDM